MTMPIGNAIVNGREGILNDAWMTSKEQQKQSSTTVNPLSKQDRKRKANADEGAMKRDNERKSQF
ncbi:hypothetical protein [Ensifer sp. B1-9]|uniref:hypothetical protein n=1 Tax=Ensifer sp. B1-9 TaxID=3141455 RepID=UPI003D234F8A